ncbi:hypothetical protein AA0112_g342 [Alternaria arborescens]|uniref:hypothetical protein n=1 Tax=Alternaria arborescens TaxID=156630 RepID=UPI001075628F|nr:hypothetical protein AA0111_g1780 [Alternaria arborescens]RYN44014.1 hypothetical protein AA0112_g342 [Alternaria arborescens]RYO39630.1 hypothetical protein AA0111_g1780 [Alternaria arborescens]
MAPRRRKQLYEDVQTIMLNWDITSFDKCLPKTLCPNHNQEWREWSNEFMGLLSSIASTPNTTHPDFKKRLRKTIQIRKEKDSSAIGSKEVDLKTVLEEYRSEAEKTSADTAHPGPSSQEKPVDRTAHRASIQIPKTPINQEDEDEDEEEEEGSSEPLAGGKYQYLNGVKPVKVDLNPEASAAKKPTRPQPATRGKRRKAHEESVSDPLAAELPSQIHQDPDPRAPDDTGFLSDLDGDGMDLGGRKRKKRLSRLQQQRVREPHWQMEMDNTAADVPDLDDGLDTPTVRREVKVPSNVGGGDVEDSFTGNKEDVAMKNTEDMPVSGAEDSPIHTGQDVIMNDGEDVELELELENLPEIPENATVAERREMEELRLKMEQRVWRIKVLRIKERERGGSEMTEQDENSASVENDVASNGRVLRKRRGK